MALWLVDEIQFFFPDKMVPFQKTFVDFLGGTVPPKSLCFFGNGPPGDFPMAGGTVPWLSYPAWWVEWVDELQSVGGVGKGVTAYGTACGREPDDV